MDGSVILGNRFFRESLSEILQNRSGKKSTANVAGPSQRLVSLIFKLEDSGKYKLLQVNTDSDYY